MATSMVRMPVGGQSFLFTVSKATGSKFSQQNYTTPKFKSFSTTKDNMSLVDIKQNLFTKQDGAGTVKERAINYIFPSFQPYKLPKETMKLFGFNPENAVECPILTPPSIDQLEQLVNVACPVEGAIFTGVVNLGKFGTGDSHFYVVFANPGNIHKIASRTGMPLSVLRNSLASPLGILAQWAGNMMAGGGIIQLDKEGERLLQQMAREQMERQNVVIGTGDLTVGRDQVELSRPERIMSGGATMFSFLARTKYFHALSGSVLHMQHVSASGNICWAWVGAGGKGFNSREVNNLTAIDLNLGMWPDMAKSIRTFYDNPDLMKLFVTGDPEDYQKLISMLVSASQEQRGTILDIIQRAQVSMGFGARFKGILTHGAQQVPGDK